MKIDRKLMMEMYHQGKTYIEIADYFGTKSGKNIERLILSEGEKDRHRILTLWKSGWGIERIMEDCSCTKEEIEEIISDNERKS